MLGSTVQVREGCSGAIFKGVPFRLPKEEVGAQEIILTPTGPNELKLVVIVDEKTALPFCIDTTVAGDDNTLGASDPIFVKWEPSTSFFRIFLTIGERTLELVLPIVEESVEEESIEDESIDEGSVEEELNNLGDWTLLPEGCAFD